MLLNSRTSSSAQEEPQKQKHYHQHYSRPPSLRWTLGIFAFLVVSVFTNLNHNMCLKVQYKEEAFGDGASSSSSSATTTASSAADNYMPSTYCRTCNVTAIDNSTTKNCILPDYCDSLKYDYHTNFVATRAKFREADGYPLWFDRHNLLKQRVRNSNPDLLMIGDSIMHLWEKKHGLPMWAKYFENNSTQKYKSPVQIGSSGDCTEHVLWRVLNGAIDGCSPKLVVLLVGTNNSGRRDPPEETAYGIQAILKEIRKRLTHSKVLLLSIFPRSNKRIEGKLFIDEDSSKNVDLSVNNQNNNASTKELQNFVQACKNVDTINNINLQTNAIIQTYADNTTVFYLDLWNMWLLEKHDNTTTHGGEDDHAQEKLGMILNVTLMKDYVHPTLEGYDKWGQHMEPIISRLMNV